jgi:hypothetical protein
MGGRTVVFFRLCRGLQNLRVARPKLALWATTVRCSAAKAPAMSMKVFDFNGFI